MTTEKTQKDLQWGECKHCWGVFLGLRKSKKYCSNACKQKAFQKRKKIPTINVIVIKVNKKPSLRVKLMKLLQKLASIPF